MTHRNPQAATPSGVETPTWIRRAALALSVAVAGLAAPVGAGDPASAASRAITFPVSAGALADLRWTDTWGAARSGGRSHIGVDIMGPKMVPLVAAADGRVTWGRFDNRRGSIVRIRDDAGWEYQYIHINNDRPDTDDGQASCQQALSEKLCANLDGGRIRTGVRVAAGEVIGYLGDSGNAEWTGSHLHFEVYRPSAVGVVAVNPTPFVDAAAQRVTDGGPPLTGEDLVVAGIHQRLQGRSPTAAEWAELRAVLAERGRAGVLADHLTGDPAAAGVDRLYLAFFLRQPDPEGWDYWIGVRSRGHRLEEIAEWFAQSGEFERRYAGGTFSHFLDRLYHDVLGRPPDAEGKRYWLDRLEAGDVTRGTIVVSFTEGEELQGVARERTELMLLHRALDLDRPTGAEVAAWRQLRAASDLEPAIVDLLRRS